jgi:hypothetical protein
VERYVVIVVQNNGYAALGVFGVGFGDSIFGQYDDPPRPSQSDGDTQPGDSASDDYEINLLIHTRSALARSIQDYNRPHRSRAADRKAVAASLTSPKS